MDEAQEAYIHTRVMLLEPGLQCSEKKRCISRDITFSNLQLQPTQHAFAAHTVTGDDGY